MPQKYCTVLCECIFLSSRILFCIPYSYFHGQCNKLYPEKVKESQVILLHLVYKQNNSLLIPCVQSISSFSKSKSFNAFCPHFELLYFSCHCSWKFVYKNDVLGNFEMCQLSFQGTFNIVIRDLAIFF